MPAEQRDREGFAQLFTEFLTATVAASPSVGSPIVDLLRGHFRTDPASLAIVSRAFPAYERPNIQFALEAWLSQRRRQHSLVGFAGRGGMPGVTFSSLLNLPGVFSAPPRLGPVEYSTVEVGLGETTQCVQLGLYLVRGGAARRGPRTGPEERFNPDPRVHLDVVSADRELAGAILAAIADIARVHNVYRGKAVSLHQTNYGVAGLDFHRLPHIDRGAIVLAPGVLERLEAHTIGFSRQASKLRAAGRHLRRGLLLYGPPGTGKTLSVMYLAGQMPERTIILLAGGDMAITPACQMARALAPSLVILEDVDLVAEDRTRGPAGRTPLLFSLMNEMDGLDDDEDVIFVLTTNRADLLEPALAARPGRVDEAVEIGLPDPSSRRRLIDLYGTGLDMRVRNIDDFVGRTEGVSAAFIKELMRKAAVLAAENSGSRRRLAIGDQVLNSALEALLQGGSTLRTALVGASPTPPLPPFPQ